jgi:hypothetical protein
MSFARDAYAVFRKILLVEDRIAQLTEGVKTLQAEVNAHGERLARVEGKLELLETVARARPKKLPQ